MKHRFHWMTWLAVSGTAFALLLSFPGAAQPQTRLTIFDAQQGIYYADANDRTIRALPVRDNIYMIVGAGGNITVQRGEDGVLVVDTGSGGAVNDKVLSLVRQLSSKPIQYIIITGNPGRNPDEHRIRLVTVKRSDGTFTWGTKAGETNDQ